MCTFIVLKMGVKERIVNVCVHCIWFDMVSYCLVQEQVMYGVNWPFLEAIFKRKHITGTEGVQLMLT